MAIETQALSALAFPQPGFGVLPSIGQGGQLTASCDIPNDASPRGCIAFTYATTVSHDASVDVQFTFSFAGGSFVLHTTTVEVQSMHLTVGLSPGENVFSFHLDKGGTVIGEPPTNWGGAGDITFDNIVLFYQRASLQGDWTWCHKCQGLFFKDHPGSRCPAGGAHEDKGSGNYRLIL